MAATHAFLESPESETAVATCAYEADEFQNLVRCRSRRGFGLGLLGDPIGQFARQRGQGRHACPDGRQTFPASAGPILMSQTFPASAGPILMSHDCGWGSVGATEWRQAHEI